MSKFNALLIALIASVVMAGTVLGDQTERDEQVEWEQEYLSSDE